MQLSLRKMLPNHCNRKSTYLNVVDDSLPTKVVTMSTVQNDALLEKLCRGHPGLQGHQHLPVAAATLAGKGCQISLKPYAAFIEESAAKSS